MTWRVMPAMIAGSPAPARWCARVEPVPVAAAVGRGGLLRVGDEEGVLLGELVHPGAGGEVGGVLLAAVQHDDQRYRRTGVAGGDVEVVASGPGRLGVVQVADLAAGCGGRRSRDRRRGARGCRVVNPSGRLAPGFEVSVARSLSSSPPAGEAVVFRTGDDWSSRRCGPERALQDRERLRQLSRTGEPQRFGHACGAVVVHGSPFGGVMLTSTGRSAPYDGSPGGAGGEGRLDRLRCPEGAKDVDRGDRGQRKIGAHVVGDRRQPEDA